MPAGPRRFEWGILEHKLWTSRWAMVKRLADDGVPAPAPVRISLGLPRFWPAAKHFPYVTELAPHGLFKVTDREEFTARYFKRLDGYGLGLIAERLTELVRAYPAGLVLLCYEQVLGEGATWCHRQTFAEWWQRQTGLTIPELDPDTWRPAT